MRAARRLLTAVIGTAVALAATGLAAPPTSAWQVSDLARLSQLSYAEVQRVLADYRGLAPEALSSSPADVAGWWRGLRDREQLRLLATMPEVVGNLPGVQYAIRDQANRMHLQRSLDEAAAAASSEPRDLTASRRLSALQAIEGALRGAGDAPRTLVQLTDDDPPLASIAVGDLDTAARITFAVPGMGTTTEDMQLWTRAAENIRTAQGTAGITDSRAVIAWIGYRTPPVGVEAAKDTYAEGGAPLLRRDIKALQAARSATWQPSVSIVAHSYGATMAALALSRGDLGLYAFVMLGSAGVDTRIGSAADLGAQRVYAGESLSDSQARWGRIDRRDPRVASFGATVIGVNGSGELRGVTGHAPIVHSPWNDNPESPLWTAIADPQVRAARYATHMATYGYLDAGTQSLDTVGRITVAPLERTRALSGLPEAQRGVWRAPAAPAPFSFFG